MRIARGATTLGALTGCKFAACGALALVLLGLSPAGDPYQIYERARDVWRKQVYPDPIAYRTTVHVSEGAKEEQEHFSGQASITDGIRVAGVSEEEAAAPHNATGINFKVHLEIGWNVHSGGQLGTYTQDSHRKESSPDYLGVPLISPEYSFGLDTTRQPEPRLAPGPSAPPDSLSTIATVNAIDRVYDIALLGTEPLGGFSAYHLRLQPRRDPAKYRLRDLWVDVYSYSVLKLVTQGNFTGAPMNAVLWEVTFQDIGGAMYIDTEMALEPLAFRSDRTFTAASISFSDIKVPDSQLPVLPFMDSGQILREP